MERANQTDSPVGMSPWAQQAQHGNDPHGETKETDFPPGTRVTHARSREVFKATVLSLPTLRGLHSPINSVPFVA